MKNIIKKMFFALSLGFGFFNIFGQNLSPEVLTGGGDYYEYNNKKFTWTLGEMSINTYDTNKVILTQGFHQTEYTISSIFENPNNTLNAKLYPNPTNNLINLTFDKLLEKDIYWQLNNITGQKLQEGSISKGENYLKLVMQELSASTYILNLYSNKKLLITYKITKSE